MTFSLPARTLCRLAAAATLVAALGAGGVAVAGSAGAARTSSEFYLSLGASVSVGVQPTLGHPGGTPTHRGFSNDLVRLEARRGVVLHLTTLGCPGATTRTMLHGGDACRHDDPTQLARAVAFLRAHRHDHGIVTLDIGFNDVLTCLAYQSVDASCVHHAARVLPVQIEQIMAALQAAAGPGVIFAGLNLYDPYVAAAITGTGTSDLAAGSLAAVVSMNDALSLAYAESATPVVDVASVFSLTDTTAVHASGSGLVARNVLEACRLTWMCQPRPYGPNIHPNDAGYRLIAAAIQGTLFPR